MNRTVFKRKTIKQEKIDAVKIIENDIRESQSVIFTDFCGLTVSDMNELRQKLSDAGVKYKVVKNTLARIATKNLQLEDVHSFLIGPTAIAYGKEDPVAPAKILAEFAKKNDNLKIKGGVLDGKIMQENEVQNLAKLPSREELLTMLVTVMLSPIRGLVTVLQGNIRNLVNVLNEIRKQKEQNQ